MRSPAWYKLLADYMKLTIACCEGVSARPMSSEHHWEMSSHALMFQSRHIALSMEPLGWNEVEHKPKQPASNVNSSSS